MRPIVHAKSSAGAWRSEWALRATSCRIHVTPVGLDDTHNHARLQARYATTLGRQRELGE